MKEFAVAALCHAPKFSTEVSMMSTSICFMDKKWHRQVCLDCKKKTKKQNKTTEFLLAPFPLMIHSFKCRENNNVRADYSSAFGRYCLTTLTIVDTSAMAPLPARENTQLDGQITHVL